MVQTNDPSLPQQNPAEEGWGIPLSAVDVDTWKETEFEWCRGEVLSESYVKSYFNQILYLGLTEFPSVGVYKTNLFSLIGMCS